MAESQSDLVPLLTFIGSVLSLLGIVAALPEAFDRMRMKNPVAVVLRPLLYLARVGANGLRFVYQDKVFQASLKLPRSVLIEFWQGDSGVRKLNPLRKSALWLVAYLAISWLPLALLLYEGTLFLWALVLMASAIILMSLWQINRPDIPFAGRSLPKVFAVGSAVVQCVLLPVMLVLELMLLSLSVAASGMSAFVISRQLNRRFFFVAGVIVAMSGVSLLTTAAGVDLFR